MSRNARVKQKKMGQNVVYKNCSSTLVLNALSMAICNVKGHYSTETTPHLMILACMQIFN
jgi:hypothetical protein